MDEGISELRKRYADCGQGHVFKYWDTLSGDEKTILRQQLEKFDPAALNRYFKTTQEALEPLKGQKQEIDPFPEKNIDSIEGDSELSEQKLERWTSVGLKLIAAGKLAVILLAGGQGTRLGSALPKGCYNIGLKSGKSLLQLQAERIRRVQAMASEATGSEVEVPWYIMTSDATCDSTAAHFEEHSNFGLSKSQIKFFKQDRIPAFDYSGKLLMETKYSLSLSPNGNGGVYESLKKSGIFSEIENRGIEYVHIYCVDNVLCKVADPAFVGYAHDVGADVAVKAVKKRNPEESAGVFCLKGGVPGVAEYTELPPQLAKATTPAGGLVLYAANIANHLLSTKALKNILSLRDDLPYHVSNKKIKCLDTSGIQVTPKTPNGIKLEKFLFDVFSHGNSFRVLMVDREEEFVPLKNAPGNPEDSPEYCFGMFVCQSTRFATKAGATIVNDQESPTPYFELSPLLSYRGEGLEWMKGKVIKCSSYIARRE